MHRTCLGEPLASRSVAVAALLLVVLAEDPLGVGAVGGIRPHLVGVSDAETREPDQERQQEETEHPAERVALLCGAAP
ncbi:hypothetical protein HY733_03080 [Candidatus Uhrbacteria bacterium]|nr:hypothetical protein [Candidatus Uhrbacteria bacterium]